MALCKVTKRCVKTIVVIFVMMNVGVNIGVFNPTFPDIAVLTHSSKASISTTLIWVGLACIGGTLAFGPLFDRLNGLLLLTGGLVLQGIAIGLAPFWPNLYSFQALAAISCIFNFALMSGCLSLNCAMWKTKPAMLMPIIQATDLMHALGTAIAPQIVRPFLSEGNKTDDFSGHSAPNSSDYGDLLQPVQLAYIVVGAFDIATAAVCLGTYVWSRGHRCCRHGAERCCNAGMCRPDSFDADDDVQLIPEHDQRTHGHMTGSTSNVSITPRSRRAMFLLVIMSLFFVTNGGRDALLTGLLCTFTTYLGWTADQCTYVLTGYHVTRVVVHAVLVPISRWASPVRLTILNLAILIVGAILLFVGTEEGSSQTLQIFTAGIIVTGIATSNVNPTAITVVEKVIHVSAPIMAILMSSSAVGQVVFGPLSGKLVESVGKTSFPAILLSLTLAGCVLFGIWCISLRNYSLADERHRLMAADLDISYDGTREDDALSANSTRKASLR